MTIARQRQAQHATFARVALKEEGATSRLPSDGLPEHISSCVQRVQGSDQAPVQLIGPASRAAEVSRAEGAGDESEEGTASEPEAEVGASQPDSEHLHESVAVSIVAVDPVHDVAPVQVMQALAAKPTAVQEQAEQISKT